MIHEISHGYSLTGDPIYLATVGKGHEYFVKHLVGGRDHILTDTEHSWQPEDVKINGEAAGRENGSVCQYGFSYDEFRSFFRYFLPAATWYEKYDISSTDMHPFVHPFNAAISPPWEARSDWDAFREISKVFSELAERTSAG